MAKRILIFDPNWLGDVVMSLPFIRAVRENFPDAFIAVALPIRCREVVQDCPDLNQIIFFDERVTHRGIFKKISFVQQLRQHRFDTAFLIHGSATRAFLCYLAGIKNRISYESKKRGWLLTHKSPVMDKNKLHRVDFYLGILEGLGFRISTRQYEFFINDIHRRSIEDKLYQAGIKRGEPFAVLHPGANEAIRRWPIENFVALSKYIRRHCGLHVVISGSKLDVPLGGKIEELSKGERIVNLCGQTSLPELAALLEKAVFLVCGDTGPMHIGSGVGTFVIALFGTASPAITAPRGKGKYIILQKDVGCSIPCCKLDCEDNRCMKAITCEDVARQIKNFVETKTK